MFSGCSVLVLGGRLCVPRAWQGTCAAVHDAGVWGTCGPSQARGTDPEWEVLAHEALGPW